MWETSQGVRTLEGTEAFLVRELVCYLLDQILVGIDIDEPHRTDVPVFDSLQPTQQLVMLHEIATGLLDPHSSPVSLSAINEGTIYAVFCELRSLIEVEIDIERLDGTEDRTLRTAAIEAWLQNHRWESDEADDEIPKPDSTDMDHWAWFVELIADEILWDRDFDMDGILGDIPPEKADLLKAHLGIQRNYYAMVAPDVLEVQIDEISSKIRALVSSFDSPTADF